MRNILLLIGGAIAALLLVSATQPALAAPTAATGVTLTGPVWQWASVAEGTSGAATTVPTPASYTIQFNPDGTANIKADCNNVIASYTAQGQSLTITLGPSTMAYCGEASLDTQYLQLLSQAQSYTIDGSQLKLTTQNNAQMTFNSGAAQADGAQSLGPDILRNKKWQWVQTRYADGSTEDNPNAAAYWLAFFGDGVFVGRADCNVGRGTYRANDKNQIWFRPAATTLKQCGASTRFQDLVDIVLNAEGYRLEDSGKVLVIARPSAGYELIFRDTGAPPQDAVPTQGSRVWGWTERRDPSGQDITIDNPSAYILQFKPDGTFNFRADCNTGSGTFTADSRGAVTLTPGAMTLALCPPGSQADNMLAALNSVTGYRIEDGGAAVVLILGDSGVEDVYRPVAAAPSQP
ncbi:MAG: META domain-containing protein [Anaerolineae bacterium]